MTKRAWAQINLSALRHNFDYVRQCVPDSKVMAMVKANAYGHGSVPVAKALNQANAFGVASLNEALTLREAGIEQPVVLMAGVFNEDELKAAYSQRLRLVVHSDWQVEALASHPSDYPVQVWLNLDTGMHRLGFNAHQAHKAYERLRSIAHVRKPLGLMTHFANADCVSDEMTYIQLERFNTFLAEHPARASVGHSAFIMAGVKSYMNDAKADSLTVFQDYVRPGLMLYGASPFAQTFDSPKRQSNTLSMPSFSSCSSEVLQPAPLRPVMTLKARILAIHDLKPGDRVGYGGTWTATDEARIATISIGYGDGYPRHARSGTPVWVQGQRCPLVGRVSMDMVTVDVSAVPKAGVGDEVVMWGDGLAIEEVATCSDTIAYELMTDITGRVERFYV